MIKSAFTPPLEILAAEAISSHGHVLVEVMCRIGINPIIVAKDEAPIQRWKWIKRKATAARVTRISDLHRLLDDVRDIGQRYDKQN